MVKLYHVHFGAPIGWVQVLAEGPSQAATDHSILHLLDLHKQNIVKVRDLRTEREWVFSIYTQPHVESMFCTKGRDV